MNSDWIGLPSLDDELGAPLKRTLGLRTNRHKLHEGWRMNIM